MSCTAVTVLHKIKSIHYSGVPKKVLPTQHFSLVYRCTITKGSVFFPPQLIRGPDVARTRTMCLR